MPQKVYKTKENPPAVMRKQQKCGILKKSITIEDSQFYITLAFTRARQMLLSKKEKTEKKKSKSDGYYATKRIEADKIDAMATFISEAFSNILSAFPEVYKESAFYQELIEITIGVAEIKKSLAALSWASERIKKLSNQYKMGVLTADNLDEVKRRRKAFEGRFASMLKQIEKNLLFLKEANMKIKNYPAIKEMYSVAIAGFPNVGKSTLLTKMTDARPEVASYAFTTKSIMLGYFSAFDFPGSEKDVQAIDTPGTLSRPEKMNDVEKQAYSAMKNTASIIIYVFDPTGSYPLADQERLFSVISSFGKPLYIYISKTDIDDESVRENSAVIRKKHPAAFNSVSLLQTRVREKAQEYYRGKAKEMGRGKKRMALTQ
jgi:nucleolar GTP-binding protein